MRKIVLVMLLIIVSNFVMAESISVVGVDIAIGMNKSKIYAEFQNYKISCPTNNNLTGVLVLDCDSWLIMNTSVPYYAIAYISFKENKVTNVIRYFESGKKPELNDFYQTFYLILNQMTNNGTKQILVQTKDVQQGAFHQKAIFLIDGSKSINIRFVDSFTDDSGTYFPASVNISEELK